MVIIGKDFDGIRRQFFGVEVECTGLTRKAAANALAELMGGSPYHVGGGYDCYEVTNSKGRTWQIVSDASIDCEDKNGNRASKLYSVEMVTPILEYEDIGLLQNAVRVLRHNGAHCNSSTGIHIHINGEPYDARTLRNFVNIIASKENMIYDALQVGNDRERYCKKIDKEFLEELNRKKPKNLDDIKRIWYKGGDYSHIKYHGSRYCLVNLHSFFRKGTIELRAFNSVMHAGVLRAYVCLALAISNQALTQKYASARPTVSSNEKYTFRTWLLRLGMIGDEFKNCRKHLLSHLEGNIAWKNPEDAVAQRERLRAERENARVQGVRPVSDFGEENVSVPDESSAPTESECDGVLDEDECEDCDESLGMAMT